MVELAHETEVKGPTPLGTGSDSHVVPALTVTMTTGLPKTPKPARREKLSEPLRALRHRSLATTARYLRIATSKVCSTSSPLDLLPRPIAADPKPAPPQHF